MQLLEEFFAANPDQIPDDLKRGLFHRVGLVGDRYRRVDIERKIIPALRATLGPTVQRTTVRGVQSKLGKEEYRTFALSVWPAELATVQYTGPCKGVSGTGATRAAAGIDASVYTPSDVDE